MPLNRYDPAVYAPFVTDGGTLVSASALLERAALAHGLDTIRPSRSYFVAFHSALANPLAFTPNTTGLTGISTRAITRQKDRTRDALGRAGVPVPRGAVFRASETDRAVQYAIDLGVPVVVKPRSGSHGAGVSTDLRSVEHVRAAIGRIASTRFGKRPFVVEEFIPGNDYRLLVVGDRVVSVVLKIPAYVVGDSKSTVAELVQKKNRWRRENPHARSCPLKFGRDAAYWLGRQDLTPDSVPRRNRTVRLGSAGNVSAGGESVEVLEQTHSSLLDLAVRATRAIPGLDHAGVDLIGDHRLGTKDGNRVGLLEINAKPATSFNHFPMFGTPRDVSRDIVLRSCALAGFSPGLERDHISVRITIEGHIPEAFLDRFGKCARERGVGGSIRRRADGVAEALAVGRTNDVWVLASSPFTESLGNDVYRASTSHVADTTMKTRFEVLD